MGMTTFPIDSVTRLAFIIPLSPQSRGNPMTKILTLSTTQHSDSLTGVPKMLFSSLTYKCVCGPRLISKWLQRIETQFESDSKRVKGSSHGAQMKCLQWAQNSVAPARLTQYDDERSVFVQTKIPELPCLLIWFYKSRSE